MSAFRLLTPGPRARVVGEYDNEEAARLAAPGLCGELVLPELELQTIEDGLHGYEWYTVDTLNALPADPDGQNDDRATWAAAALAAFIGETGTDEDDALSDLLADLRHWADRKGKYWDAEVNRAMGHYDAETTEGGHV